MKKLFNKLYIIFLATFIVVIAGCNSGESTNETSDTAQNIPGTIDTVPPVVNPGVGDTTSTLKTPPTNDNNTIMPDSTTIAQ